MRDPRNARIDRRKLLGGSAAALAAPALLRAPHSALAQAESLDFTIWNYAEDIVQDNIDALPGGVSGCHRRV